MVEFDPYVLPRTRSCVDRWLVWSSGSAWGTSTDNEMGLSEQRMYRTWTAKQKIEIVLAGLRGDRSVKEVRREQRLSEIS